jgi:hypothetical protein
MRVEFDEPWAKEGFKAPEADEEVAAEGEAPPAAATGGDASAAA